MNRPNVFSAYIAVTSANWAFMLTDGTLRMLVLFHFHRLGFSPVMLAFVLRHRLREAVAQIFGAVKLGDVER